MTDAAATEGDDGTQAPDSIAGARSGTPHDPTGLDLARTVAAELRGSKRAPARPARPRRRTGTPAEFSGAHPDERDPAPLGAAVDRLVSDSGWSTEVSVHSVLGRWEQIVGTEIARHCTP